MVLFLLKVYFDNSGLDTGMENVYMIIETQIYFWLFYTFCLVLQDQRVDRGDKIPIPKLPQL